MLLLPRRKLIRLAAPAIILPGRSRGQMLRGVTNANPPAAATWTLKANNVAGAQTNPTTASMNMTGVNLILVAATYANGTTPSLTDSVTANNANYVNIFTVDNAASIITEFWYLYNPSVSSAQTFKMTGTNIYSSIVVQGWSGAASSPFDQTNDNNSWTGGPPATITTGSVTVPSGELVVAVLGANDTLNTGNSYSIGSGFTIPASNGQIGKTASYYGVAMAYLEPSAATAYNPTFSAAAAVNQLTAGIASFK